MLVVLDDIGIEQFRSYGLGLKPAVTPTFDWIAANGVQFDNAYVNPVCSPTRALIHTGRYAFRTGVGGIINSDADWALQVSEVTLPKLLGRSKWGFATAAFGKWHLGNASVGGIQAPNHAGYGHFAGSVRNLGSYYDWRKVVNGVEYPHTTRYATSATVDDALDWLGGRTEPWFAYVAFHAAHSSGTGQYEWPPKELLGGVGLDGVLAGRDPRRVRFKLLIHALDTELGRLLAGVDLTRTTVIVIGDNGTSRKVIEHPFRPGHDKQTVYEGGARAPLWVFGAAVRQPGRRVTSLVHGTDVFPTVARLARLDPHAIPENDGVSLLPYLREPDAPPQRSHVFVEIFRPNGFGPWAESFRAVRDERYKLIRPGEGRDEFYDLELDPFEEDPMLPAQLDPHHWIRYLMLDRELRRIVTS